MALAGKKHAVSRDEGRDYLLTLEDTGDTWVIDPPWDAVFEIDAIIEDAGVKDGQAIPKRVQAAMGRVAVQLMLTPEQRQAFGGWKAPRQAKVVAFLLDVWDELRSGEVAGPGGRPDPTPPSSGSRGGSGGRSKRSAKPARARSSGGSKRSPAKKRGKGSA